MSDTLTLKRVVDLVTQADIDSSVYTIIDSVTGAVKKYPIGSLICSIAPIFDATAAYAAGKYCNYNGQLYRFDEAHAAGSWTGSDATAVTLSEFLEAIGADVDDLKEALTQKAPLTGLSPDLVAGSAEQLLSDVGTEDKAPYLFRATPYDSTRVDEEVVGVSVGWNQAVQNGNFADTSGWSVQGGGSFSVSDNVATVVFASNTDSDQLIRSISLPSGHKYFYTATIKQSQAVADVKLYGGMSTVVASSSATTDWQTIQGVTDATPYSYWIMRNKSSAENLEVQVKDVMTIDLTAWFGSTIADHAYTLETATPGSGVAWIKQYLPSGYIPYSAPTLKSIEGLSAHVTRGFNIWDEEWEQGDITFDNGAKYNSSNYFRTKNYVKIKPSTDYYVYSRTEGLNIYFYDKNKTYLGRYTGGLVSNIHNVVVTTPDSAEYLMFASASTGHNTYSYDICINLSDPAKNGTYKPYSEPHTYDLDSTKTLRGILKMDADHRVYADGDVYESDGTVTRKYGIVDLGSLEWNYSAERQWFNVIAGQINIAHGTTTSFNSEIANVLCAKYVTVSNEYMRDTAPTVIACSVNYAGLFIVRDTAYTDAATFKTAMSGVYLVYELATPTTESADPFVSPQIIDPDGTEEYVYAEGGSGLPVGHNSKYLADLKGELERVMVAVPDAPSANGTYSLKATVSSGTVTYAWVSD